MAKPAPLSGFPEWLPGQRIVEQQVIDTLRRTFESWGYAPVETRAAEPLEELLRKGEIDKEVYVLRRLHADECGRRVQLHRAGGLDRNGDAGIARLWLHAGVAQLMFKTLAEKGINIQVITTSEIKVSVLVAEEYTELALRALHTAYGLDAQEAERVSHAARAAVQSKVHYSPVM